jgi:uncharacterized phage-associated protein
MFSSRNVANEFLRLAEAKEKPLTPMQLLKLVYIAHGWSLALHGRRLIQDEIQAWQYGPVIPRLYNAIREFRSNPVTGRLSEEGSPLDAEAKDLISQTFETYGAMNGVALSRITHAEGTPWSQTYKTGAFGLVIPDDLIRDHYESLARSRAQ